MKLSLTRRQYLTQGLAGAGVAVLNGPGCCCLIAGEAKRSTEKDWQFSLLGDIHFDRMEHHDFDWVRREKPKDIRQIEIYSRITERNLPALMQQVKKTISSTRCASVVQIGDLVEGLCGNERLARVHCEEAVAFFEDLNLGVPIRVTKGNHDVTGPGSVAAYEGIVVPWVAGGLKAQVSSNKARFIHRQHDDLSIYFDAYDSGSLNWFEELMKRRDPASDGRLFFIIHPPVVPYNARSTWCVFGAHGEKRNRLMRILGKYHAIVLCGHLHKYSFLERATQDGSFVQLAVSSVANHLDDTPKDMISGIDNYNSDLVDLEPRHSPDTVEHRRQILDREKPFIRRFDYGNFWGHAVVKVRAASVEADIYQLLGCQPWKTVKLT